jgi:MYXO-CTERM domain-containing protein
MRRLALACLVLLAVPAGAHASGGPAPPVQGGAGVTLPGSAVRYVAVQVRGGTLVERVSTRDGALERSRFLGSDLGVPGVSFDGSTTGLSGDGRTLVLTSVIRAYPPKRTTLVGLDTGRLHVAWSRSLRGFFAVDAVSPDGRWVYVIRYPSGNDPFRYEVRTFDVRGQRLLPDPVVDPREPDEKMTGMPLTRAVGAGGRWAYTLYQKQDGTGFVHALDTAGRTAACIDLPTIASGVSSTHLRIGGGGRTLLVESSAGPQAVVDTTSFAVRHPDAGTPDPAPAPQPEPPAEGDSPWVLLLLPLAALAALPALRRRRHRLGT